MKKILLLFVLVSAINSNVHSQVLNGGFENWTAGLPNNWWGLIIPPYNVFSQSAVAHSGSYAVQLHVDTIGGNPFSSPLSSGDGMSVSTHPLTFVPGALNFWYRLNAVAGDELSATAVIYSGGTGVGVVAATFPAAANYTNISTPILYGNPPLTADSIAIIFLITNTNGSPTIGSDAWIDDVSVTVGAGIADYKNDDTFTISPNPASDVVSFHVTGQHSFNELYITDVAGKTIYNAVTDGSNAVEYPVKNLRNGVYFCVAKVDGLTYRKAFVVNH